MAPSAPVSLRLSPDLQAELEQMAQETGIPMSNLMRMAIEAAVRAYRQNGGRIEVPFRFTTESARPYRRSDDPPAQMVAEDRPE